MTIIEYNRRYRAPKLAAADALFLGSNGWYVTEHPEHPTEFVLRLDAGIRAATVLRYLRKAHPLADFRLIEPEGAP